MIFHDFRWFSLISLRFARILAQFRVGMHQGHHQKPMISSRRFEISTLGIWKMNSWWNFHLIYVLGYVWDYLNKVLSDFRKKTKQKKHIIIYWGYCTFSLIFGYIFRISIQRSTNEQILTNSSIFKWRYLQD